MNESRELVLTFQSVEKKVWCDHANKTSLAGLSHGAISFLTFFKMKFRNLVVFLT